MHISHNVLAGFDDDGNPVTIELHTVTGETYHAAQIGPSRVTERRFGRMTFRHQLTDAEIEAVRAHDPERLDPALRLILGE